MNRDRSGWGCGFYDIDPLHVCGNAANLEYKTKEMFASVKKYLGSILQIGCIPTDVQGVYFPNSKDLLAVIIVVTSNGLVQFLFYLFVFYFSPIHLCVYFCRSLKICICTLYWWFSPRGQVTTKSFFDSRTGHSSVILVRLPIFGFLVRILEKYCSCNPIFFLIFPKLRIVLYGATMPRLPHTKLCYN